MKKTALNATDLDLIKKYLTAGAAVGGSAALFTSLLNKLNDIKESETNPLEGHTLKLVVKDPKAKESGTKMASSDSASFFRGPLAMAGGVLSTIGSYALVRHLYQKLKEQQLKKELEQAQDKYVTGLEQSTDLEKNSTGKPMSLLETLTSAPLAASLLLALGSGVVSYNTLKKSFPDIKRQSREALGPKRVQVVYDNPGDEPDTVLSTIPVKDLQKEASANAFLINTVAGFGGESDVVDVVNAVARGYASQINNVFANENMSAVFEKCASAAFSAHDRESINLASNWCARAPGIGPSITLTAAAEFANKSPLFFKSAANLPEHIQSALVELVSNANAKIAAGVVDKLKDVVLPRDSELQAENESVKAPELENSAENLDPQELLEMLLAAKSGDNASEDTIADLQTEDSEEAGQE